MMPVVNTFVSSNPHHPLVFSNRTKEKKNDKLASSLNLPLFTNVQKRKISSTGIKNYIACVEVAFTSREEYIYNLTICKKQKVTSHDAPGK